MLATAYGTDRQFDHLRQDDAQQPNAVAQFDRATAMSIDQHPSQFLSDSLLADDDDFGSHLAHGGGGGFIEREVERRRETDGTQHSQLVFADSFVRIADRANDPRREIGLTANVIQHARCDRIVEHPVDRKVAPLGIFFGSTERDVLGATTVEVGAFRAKGRDFNLPGRRASRRQHDDHAEARSHRQRPAMTEQRPHLLGPRGRGHVVVLRFPTVQQVSNTPARQQCLIPNRPQLANDLDGKVSLRGWGRHVASITFNLGVPLLVAQPNGHTIFDFDVERDTYLPW